MPAAERHSREQHRPKLWIHHDPLTWVATQTDMGGPFASEGHALEVAVARLHGEYAFVQQACRSEKIPFRPAVFWQLYQDLIDQARPPLAGRPAKGATPAHNVTHRRVAGFMDVRLVEWIEANCKPSGPFETAGHLVETALRHLQAQAADEQFPATGFPFDGKALLTRYRKLAKA